MSTNNNVLERQDYTAQLAKLQTLTPKFILAKILNLNVLIMTYDTSFIISFEKTIYLHVIKGCFLKDSLYKFLNIHFMQHKIVLFFLS